MSDGVFIKVTGDDVMASPDNPFIGGVFVELMEPTGP